MQHRFCYSLLTTAIWMAVIPAWAATPGDDGAASNTVASDNGQAPALVKFDPVFLSTANRGAVDLSHFELGSSAMPGTYQVDIYVNGEKVSRQNVTFAEQPDKRVRPCISMDLLKQINFNYSQLPANFSHALREDLACYPLAQLLPQASVIYDSGTQRLDITIPQAMMNNTARGYVNPALWDKGVPAFLLGYNASTYTTRSNGRSYDSAYAGINAGLNIGAWYFRHDGSYNWQEQIGSHYQSINNYVQRDVPPLEGKVRIGETTTRGELFDTVPYKGIELFSDERMLPQSQRGYAPEIRGVARTNARVTIRQNGTVIYETTVSPGAFLINDLYPSGYGGDLDVTVTEADGSVQNFQVPYASVTQLLRPGSHKFDVVAGRLHSQGISIDPGLYQATYQRGITNDLTGYGGIQGSDADYYALQVGAAFSTLIGAVSADVTQAHLHLKSADNGASSGQSYRLSYSKYLPDIGSNLTIAAYRYATEGYYDFMTAMQMLDAEHYGQDVNNLWRPRNRFNIALNQNLSAGLGQVYLTGYTQDYWNHDNSDLQYQVGYSNSWRNVSFSLSAGRVRNFTGDMETNWLFNLSMPLGRAGESYTPMLTASLNHDSSGRSGEQLGVSGTAGEDNQYSYGVTGANYNQGAGSSMTASGGWRSPYSNLNASYGASKNYQSASLGASGTLIAWPHGVVMTPYTGDNFAVVEARGAKGAKVGGYSGIRIDPWGHAAVPYLNPYEMNEVTIDPKGLPWNVELDNTSEKVAPYDGAVSRIVFKTQTGTPLLILARMANGEPAPFGAEVYDESGNNVGSVGQAGQIYARVNQEQGLLTLKLSSKEARSCHIRYRLLSGISQASRSRLVRFDSVCGH